MAAQSLLTLKEKLKQLQDEQSATAVEGIHYTKMDSGRASKEAARTVKRMMAIAPMAPPIPPPQSGSARRFSTTNQLIESADAAARRDPSQPFSTGTEEEASDRASVQAGRTLHAVQQETLNAELRLECEQILERWTMRVDSLKETLLSTIQDASNSSRAITALKRYEDLYQCVYPLDEAAIAAATEGSLQLHLSENDVSHLLSNYPKDMPSIIDALVTLLDPATTVAIARRRRASESIGRLDAVATVPISALAIRLHEDLWTDLISPLRESLTETDAKLAELRATVQRHLEKGNTARLNCADASEDTGVAPLQLMSKPDRGELLKLAEYCQLQESSARMEAVHEYANRHVICADALRAVQEYLVRCRADIDAARGGSVRLEQIAERLDTDAAHDLDVLQARTNEISERMMSDYRSFLKSQVEAHNVVMSLQAQEQAVWSEVAVKLSEAASISASRQRLVLDRLRANEDMALRQRTSALEINHLRMRQLRTKAVKKAAEGLKHVQSHFKSYVDGMEREILARDRVAEHDALWQDETISAMREYAAMLSTVDDLYARLQSRKGILDRAANQADLHLSVALETFDPDARLYRESCELYRGEAKRIDDAIQRLFADAVSVSDRARPFVDLAITRKWLSDSGYEWDQHKSTDAKLTMIESKLKELIEKEQNAVEEQLTTMRHTRAVEHSFATLTEAPPA